MKNLRILFIEDDEIEIMKFQRTIQKMDLKCTVFEAKNGEEAFDFLRSDNPLPDIILLDLNMPKMNGIEFLKILRGDEFLKYLPTIILSTSNNEKDILESYKNGVGGYIIKPLKYEDYIKKIEIVLSYWGNNELIKK